MQFAATAEKQKSVGQTRRKTRKNEARQDRPETSATIQKISAGKIHRNLVRQKACNPLFITVDKVSLFSQLTYLLRRLCPCMVAPVSLRPGNFTRSSLAKSFLTSRMGFHFRHFYSKPKRYTNRITTEESKRISGKLSDSLGGYETTTKPMRIVESIARNWKIEQKIKKLKSYEQSSKSEEVRVALQKEFFDSEVM